METSYTASSASPAVQLPTNRSLLKFVLLSIITLASLVKAISLNLH